MTTLVQILQALSGATWSLLLLLFTPALWRLLRGRADIIDLIRAPKWFLSLVMVLGAIRWLAYDHTLAFMPWDELAFWAMIYVLNIGAATGIAYAYRLTERLRR